MRINENIRGHATRLRQWAEAGKQTICKENTRWVGSDWVAQKSQWTWKKARANQSEKRF